MIELNPNRYVRRYPERIFESWGPQEVPEALIQQILTLVVRDAEFCDQELVLRSWCVIHAETDGQLESPDPENFLHWFKRQHGDALFISSRDKLEAMAMRCVDAVRLEEANQDDITDLELGLWFRHAGKRPPGYLIPSWPNWRRQIWFSPSLDFCILNSVGGEGHTIIAGPADLTDAILSSPPHECYTWHVGQPAARGW